MVLDFLKISLLLIQAQYKISKFLQLQAIQIIITTDIPPHSPSPPPRNTNYRSYNYWKKHNTVKKTTFVVEEAAGLGNKAGKNIEIGTKFGK